MRCPVCKSGEVTVTRVRRIFSEQLPDIVIDGLERGVCESCGEAYSAFPHWNELNAKLMAAIVAKTARLAHGEIRFLRIGTGLKAQELAAILSVTPSQVSRWENDAAPISPLADRLLRMVVASKLGIAPPDLTTIDHTRFGPLALQAELGRRGWKVLLQRSEAA